VADTPTTEAKAKAEDAHARPDAGQTGHDRDGRRGGRKGRGKGKGKAKTQAADGEPRAAAPKHNARDARDKPRRDRDRDRDRRSEQPLTAGLFAGVADREMPCRVAGCPNTWTWFGTQQIRSLGKPAPKRMCAEHLAQFEGIEDREMPCRNTWCTNTWTWSRGAQLFQRERQEKLKPPHRLCDQCFEEDKTTDDLEIECKIPECKNTWSWPRQAQLRHRAWVRREQAKLEAEEAGETTELAEAPASPASTEAAVEATASDSDAQAEVAVEAAVSSETDSGEADSIEAGSVEAGGVEAVPVEAVPVEAVPVEAEADSSEAVPVEADSGEAGETQPAVEAREAEEPGKKRRRKRRRKRKIHDGPPEKLCERCFERLGHLEPIEIPCKVHGCTSTWTWERDGQLRAWAVLDGQENVTELPQPPRRMCNGCFEFVRQHPDREVACGRPDCDTTWTYKTGAQLQDFLAGRTQEPSRLCEECVRSQFMAVATEGVDMPEGAEVMPCMVAGCEGSWVYAPSMRLSAADPDAAEPPLDRMCDDCRVQRGAPGRDPRRAHHHVDAQQAESDEPVIETPPVADDELAAPNAES
jgi:hypothetical protein